MHDFEVLVVGAGPVGLTLAALLGQAGVATLLVESNAGPPGEPRAVSLDDDSLRTLQQLDILPELADTVLPGAGTYYFDRRGRPLVHARGPAGVHGYPTKNPFAQPEFEQVLLRRIGALPSVAYRPCTTVTGLRHEADVVQVSLRDAAGRRASVCVPYVAGCDGGRSAVRDLVGVRMVGSSFAQPWLVVDTVADPHDVRYGMHHCDPRRPGIVIPGMGTRCRYEFMLLPGEDADDFARPENVTALIGHYRDITPGDVVRTAVYTFHALVAERWRVGRVLLAGDAAHMMPPFAGQGLNSGLRDAANLAWKLAFVLQGAGSDALLDTYEAERRPHAQEMIDLSIRLGSLIMTTSRPRAWLRDALVRLATRMPAAHRFLSEMRYKRPARYGRGFVTAGSGPGQHLVGRLFPQPRVLTDGGRRGLLDDVVAPGFVLLAVHGAGRPDHDLVDELEHPFWDRLQVQRVDLLLGDRVPRPCAERLAIADLDGRLDELLADCSGRAVLLRPDRYVAAVFGPADAARTVAQLAGCVGTSIDERDHARGA